MSCFLITRVKDREIKLNSFKSQKYRLTAGSEEFGELKKKKDMITQDIKLIEDITSRKFFWAKQLNTISDIIPEGVWITRLHLERKRSKRAASLTKEKKTNMDILIDGRVFSQDKELIDLATEFLNRLRQDEYFGKNFPNLKMGTLRKQKLAILKFYSLR